MEIEDCIKGGNIAVEVRENTRKKKSVGKAIKKCPTAIKTPPSIMAFLYPIKRSARNPPSKGVAYTNAPYAA